MGSTELACDEALVVRLKSVSSTEAVVTNIFSGMGSRRVLSKNAGAGTMLEACVTDLAELLSRAR